MQSRAVAGVDGCRGGWLCALQTEGGPHQLRLFNSLKSLWSALPSHIERICIDMPIGLPENGRRACDLQGRELLKSRRACIFFAPTRAAVFARDYAAACDANHRLSGKKISKQAWHLTPKIRELDALLKSQPSSQGIFLESHPELCFAAFNAGNPLLAAKKSTEGIQKRLDLLRAQGMPAQKILEKTLGTFRRKDVQADDVLDALVLLVTAGEDRLKAIPSSPPMDQNGFPMQIVFPEWK